MSATPAPEQAPVQPWTFVDFEAEHTDSWTVYDDNLARIVAVFYDRTEMENYLRWRNKKQAKARARAVKL